MRPRQDSRQWRQAQRPAAGVLLSAPCQVKAQPQSFYEVISANVNLTTLKVAIDTAGLNGTLSNTSLAWTIFAPTNDAFAAAFAALQWPTSWTVEQILQYAIGPADLQALLLYHVLPGAYSAASIPEAATTLTTQAGAAPGNLTVRRTGAAVSVAARSTTANVTTADMPAGSGFVHVVDAVLLPFYVNRLQAVESNPDLSTLAAVLRAASLGRPWNATGYGGTVLAPTNAAFNRTLSALKMTTDQLLADRVRLAGVISYLDVMPMDVYSLNHVLMSANFTDSPTQLRSGPHNVTAVRQNGSVVFQTATVNASITVADIPIGLGYNRAVMHLIDAAIVPGYPTLAAALASNPQLSTLAAAVAADGTLAAIASGAVPFTGTFLAPNNDAFAQLLLALGLSALPSASVLRPILQTHLVPGTVLNTEDIDEGLIPSTRPSSTPSPTPSPAVSPAPSSTPPFGTFTTLNGQTVQMTMTSAVTYGYDTRIRGPGNNGSGAQIVGDEIWISGTASMLVLDAVLLPSMPPPSPPSHAPPSPPSPPSPGAASSALPSLCLLATSALAALALGLFARLQ